MIPIVNTKLVANQRILLGVLLVVSASSTLAAQDRKSGLEASAFDRKIRVQDDLYQAVNGSWLQTVEIPSDKSNYGSFIVLDDLSNERIRKIIETAAGETHPKGSDLQKVGDLYKSFMDEPRIKDRGIAPLQPMLEQIRKLSTKAELMRWFGKQTALGIQTPVGFFVDQDDKDSTRYLATIIQSGTTLPDRDYYLEADEKYAVARTALQTYVDKLLELRDEPKGTVATTILEIEKRLAEIQWKRTELRDAEKRYNKFTLADWKLKTPALDWSAYFAAAQVPELNEVNVATPSFFEGLSKMIDDTSVDAWKQYLEFKLFDDAAPYLAPDFELAHFELHSKVLGGIPEQKPRWKRGVELVSGTGAGSFGALGDVVGKRYVELYFPAEAKSRMDVLVKNLLKAYESSIRDLAWMTDETKEKAQAKLRKITTKIGFTTKWRAYDALQIDPQDLLGNIQRSTEVEYQRMLNKLGKPIDREEWGMTPQTVNAYYNPGMNEIVFPAAILQPPFFAMEADDAVNYGGIGAVIGHEISHAFDDQGCKFDGDGNLNNWWSPRDKDAFQKLTRRLIDQYNAYRPLPDKTVNGELTLGENIADLSGLSIAYKAYKLALAGNEPPRIDDWTGDQRFFLGWSQVWRRKYRDAEMMKRLLTDPHAPSWYRANGPVINIDAFYDAFAVKPSDQLYRAPEERIRIW